MGDDTDPATAPRGRSLYMHFLVSHIGQSYFGIMTEKKRLKRLGKSFFSLSNRWIRGYLMSIPTVALFAGAGYVAGGQSGVLIGLAVMLVVWVISNFELEALNYMEHYGLIRVKNQPIEFRHSWDNDNAFTSWAFIEIGRQADHHDRGETHFLGIVQRRDPVFALRRTERDDWLLHRVRAGPDAAPVARGLQEEAGDLGPRFRQPPRSARSPRKSTARWVTKSISKPSAAASWKSTTPCNPCSPASPKRATPNPTTGARP